MPIAIDSALDHAGIGPFQRRLLGIFGLVWAADAMQVLAVGFTAPSIAASFGLSVPEALQTGTLFFFGMMIGAALFGQRPIDRFLQGTGFFRSGNKPVFTICRILFKSWISPCTLPKMFRMHCRASCLPCSRLTSAPSFPACGSFPFTLQLLPEVT